jgi:hypothetical protein
MLSYTVEVDKENTIDVANFTASDVAPANNEGEELVITLFGKLEGSDGSPSTLEFRL